MHQRRRKLIGAALLLVVVPLYALIVAAAASALRPDMTNLTRSIFFLVTGMIWVLPAALVISWMSRPDDRRQD